MAWVVKLSATRAGVPVPALCSHCIWVCLSRDLLRVQRADPVGSPQKTVFEALLDELCMPWSLNKRRVPAQVMEFLGHLIVNSGALRCIALTRSRQARVLGMLDMWAEKRPATGCGGSAEPLNLARFLGHLIFASEMVPGGRAFMQALLRQFQGLEVDWARGSVRYVRSSSPWGRVPLARDFWADLVWFRSALATRNCTPLEEPAAGEAAIAGSDPTGTATGLSPIPICPSPRPTQ